MKKDKNFLVLAEDIIIPKGTVMYPGPSEVVWGEKNYICTLPATKSGVIEVIIGESDAVNDPRFFPVN